MPGNDDSDNWKANSYKKGEAGFWHTFVDYPVHNEWADELYNYFMCGWTPGGFHTSMLANDMYGAACRTHVSNNWKQIAEFMKWVGANAPAGSWGSYDEVDRWIALKPAKRRQILEEKKWKLTEKELMWKMVSEE